MSTVTAPISSNPNPGAPLPGTTLAPVTSIRAWPRKPDDSIDWKAVAFEEPQSVYVKAEHKEKAAKLLNKPVTELYNLTAEDLKKIPDFYLVIRKAGILRLARLRGFISATPKVMAAARDFVVVQTWIEWDDFVDDRGNVIDGKVTGGVGEASPENTSELGCRYPAATAENRAFSRAVRQFLEIDIVSSDELGKDGIEPEIRVSSTASATTTTPGAITSSSQPGTPWYTLETNAGNAKLTVADVKAYALARWGEESAQVSANPSFKRTVIEQDPTTVEKWTDFKPRDCLTLITAIQTARELESLCTENGHTFDQVKNAALSRWNDWKAGKIAKCSIQTDPSKWTRWFDIHFQDAKELIALIKAAKAGREKNKAEAEKAAATPPPAANQNPAPDWPATTKPAAAKRTRKPATTPSQPPSQEAADQKTAA